LGQFGGVLNGETEIAAKKFHFLLELPTTFYANKLRIRSIPSYQVVGVFSFAFDRQEPPFPVDLDLY